MLGFRVMLADDGGGPAAVVVAAAVAACNIITLATCDGDRTDGQSLNSSLRAEY